MIPPTFSVFVGRKASPGECGDVIYSTEDSNAVWPKLVRRGRPRKDVKERKHSSEFSLKREGRVRDHYAFLDCSNGRQPSDPRTRTFVRTHVMHNYRRQQRVAVAVSITATTQVQQNRLSKSDEESIQGSNSSLVASPACWSIDPFDSFSIKWQPYMQELLYLYVSAVANQLYSIEAYWGFNPTKSLWVPLALTDPALLNSILSASAHYHASLGTQTAPAPTNSYLQHAIRILNERLQGPSHDISDSTIAAVAGLAITEQASGNQENWRIHMKGVKLMVDLRGGLSAFEHNPILHDKLCRADICGSIYDLTTPHFHLHNTTIGRTICGIDPESIYLQSSGFQALHEEHTFDIDLLDVVYNVQQLTLDMNIVNPPKSDNVPIQLRQRIRAIQYYLLAPGSHLEVNTPEDAILKACRLGILLYLSIIQNDFSVLPISEHFIRQLKSCLEMAIFNTNSTSALRLWLLFLITPLVPDLVERTWFVCAVAVEGSRMSLSSWHDVRLHLESFAWVGKIQDRSGMDLWDEAVHFNDGQETRQGFSDTKA